MDIHAPNSRVRYGIIGFGLFSERTIAPAIRASHNSELVAIQKRSISTAREKASALSIPLAFSSAEELVAHPDVDAVFIVSANSAHYPETLAAANAGKHVIVEKPIAMNVREAEQMIDACSRHGVKLMVGHMIRFSPLALRMREIVHSGTIGRIVFARSEFFYDGRLTHRAWLTDRAVAGGGPTFDIGVHCLDTLRFILQDEVVSVKSHLHPSPTETATERTAALVLEFAQGCIASILCSYETPTRRATIEIAGTKGMIHASDFTLGDRVIPLQLGLREDGTTGATRQEEIKIPNLYVEEITSFSKSILTNSEVTIPGSVGLENQRVLDLAMLGGGVISHS